RGSRSILQEELAQAPSHRFHQNISGGLGRARSAPELLSAGHGVLDMRSRSMRLPSGKFLAVACLLLACPALADDVADIVINELLCKPARRDPQAGLSALL